MFSQFSIKVYIYFIHEKLHLANFISSAASHPSLHSRSAKTLCQQKFPSGMWMRARLAFGWHWNITQRGLSLTWQFAAVLTWLPWLPGDWQTLVCPQLFSVLSKESTLGPSCCARMPAGALMSQLWHGKSQDLWPHLDQEASVVFKPAKNIRTFKTSINYQCKRNLYLSLRQKW